MHAIYRSILLLLLLSLTAVGAAQAETHPQQPSIQSNSFTIAPMAAVPSGGQQTNGPAACNPTWGSGGFGPGIHETTVAGLTAAVIVGDKYNSSKPTYLGYYLHGDGGNWFRFLKAGNPVTKLVQEQNWILVSPEAPNGDSWWRDQVGDHRKKLANVLDEMFEKYNVCRDAVLGASGSGGSEFWTAQFFPEYGNQYPTFMMVACGGNGFSDNRLQKVKRYSRDNQVNASTRIHYVYGTKDYLHDLIQRSITTYRKTQFDIRTEVLQNAGHCNKWVEEGFPHFHDHMVEKWSQFSRQFPPLTGVGQPGGGGSQEFLLYFPIIIQR